MKFWIDLPKQKRLRIWILKPHFAKLSFDDWEEERKLIILGIIIDRYCKGIIIFNYEVSIYLRSSIMNKRNITTTWQGKEQSRIGFNKD